MSARMKMLISNIISLSKYSSHVSSYWKPKYYVPQVIKRPLPPSSWNDAIVSLCEAQKPEAHLYFFYHRNCFLHLFPYVVGIIHQNIELKHWLSLRLWPLSSRHIINYDEVLSSSRVLGMHSDVCLLPPWWFWYLRISNTLYAHILEILWEELTWLKYIWWESTATETL